MTTIIKLIGQRLRNYRVQKKLSQEKLAELSGCHPTYIGQIERGEKNATIESIAKIAAALELPLTKLFENLDTLPDPAKSIPNACYEFLSSKSEKEQEQLFQLLLSIDAYKN